MDDLYLILIYHFDRLPFQSECNVCFDYHSVRIMEEAILYENQNEYNRKTSNSPWAGPGISTLSHYERWLSEWETQKKNREQGL